MVARIVLAGILFAGLPAIGQDRPWLEVGTEHFVLYTDTDLEKAERLVADLEARYAAFSRTIIEIGPRPGPIGVFLMRDQESFAEAVPEKVLNPAAARTAGAAAPRRANRRAYLVDGSAGAFIIARDRSPEDIAKDVAHQLGHLLLARSALWQPLWLQEGVGEYLRRLGTDDRDSAVSGEDAESIDELLRIRPGPTFDDLGDGGRFRIQSYHLLRVLLDRHRAAFDRYFAGLSNADGSRAPLEVDPEVLAREVLSYVESPLPLEPVRPMGSGRELSQEELDAARGDLMVSAGWPSRARRYYESSSAFERSSVGLAMLATEGTNTVGLRRGLERLAEQFPESGMIHFYLGTLPVGSADDRSEQIASLRRAVELEPLSGRVRAELGLVYALDGEPERGIVLVGEALRLEPEYGDRFFEILAECRLLSGDYGAARRSIRVAADLPHSDATTEEYYTLVVRSFDRRLEDRRRAVESARVAELRREVQALADRVDPRPVPSPSEPVPFGRVTVSVSSSPPEDVVEPIGISAPLPEYPERLRKQGIEGRVVLDVDLGRRGTVAEARVRNATLPDLGELSLEAVRRWVFEPARRNGESVPFSFRLTLVFRLD